MANEFDRLKPPDSRPETADKDKQEENTQLSSVKENQAANEGEKPYDRHHPEDGKPSGIPGQL
jgi:hypothetical protein